MARGANEEIDLMLQGSIVAPVFKAGAVFLEAETNGDSWQALAGARFRF